MVTPLASTRLISIVGEPVTTAPPPLNCNASELLKEVEPFPTHELIAYDTSYLSGFVVEHYQVVLLDAAKAGTNKLDALLREERARLNREFFEHMRWEVEEQTKAKNRRMLDILEVVVQRACIEVEEGRTEVALRTPRRKRVTGPIRASRS
jgi:hypothetical protein